MREHLCVYPLWRKLREFCLNAKYDFPIVTKKIVDCRWSCLSNCWNHLVFSRHSLCFSAIWTSYFLDGFAVLCAVAKMVAKNNMHTIFEELYLQARGIFLSDSGVIGFARCCQTRIWQSCVDGRLYSRGTVWEPHKHKKSSPQKFTSFLKGSDAWLILHSAAMVQERGREERLYIAIPGAVTVTFLLRLSFGSPRDWRDNHACTIRSIWRAQAQRSAFYF